MHESVEALGRLFPDPPNTYRHLAIIHGFQPGHRYNFQLESVGGAEGLPTDIRQAIHQRLVELASWGFGGVVANVVPPDYLENEREWAVFFAGVEEAANLGMRIWIYDEDGYPSGAAGGVVLRDHPEYEAQGLTRLCGTFTAGRVELRPPQGWLCAFRDEAVFNGQDPVDVTSSISDDGWLRFDAPSDCIVRRFDARRAFEGTHATQNVFAIRRYVNLLQHEAVDYFFKISAEQYLRRLGANARHIEAVFTDEPSFMTSYFPDLPKHIAGKVTVQDQPQRPFDLLPMITWEPSLADRFRARWGYELLPEVNRLYEGSDARDRRVRHDFYQVLSEVYEAAFFESQQAKLALRGIEFSGHVLSEENLVLHAATQGNTIANLKHMGIPGIDSLGSLPEENIDSMHLLACKYGSSAAHASRRSQVMSESSDWVQQISGGGADLTQRRGALAVQMALGITTITSYYSWHDTDAEGRRALLDFCARIAVVMRNTTHVADVAVLYPIRTAWTCFKPSEHVIRGELQDEPLKSMDGNLHQIARAILKTGRDFDFIDTRDLIDATIADGRLGVGDESYSVLVIPPGAVMCPKDIERTEDFAREGGLILAFEPCSEFVLPEIASPPDGRDIGQGRSPAVMIGELVSTWPDRVERITLGGDWPALIKHAPSNSVNIYFDGEYLIARQSKAEDRLFVLIANASREDARARVEFPAGRQIELWDPRTGGVSSAGSNVADLGIEGYGAIIITG